MTEHAVTETLRETVFYPDHPPRTESEVFRQAKEQAKQEGLVCCVCGAPNPELHHALVEWAFSDAVDWAEVKAIALGQREMVGKVPMKQSLVYWLLQIVRLRGFHWDEFDPAHPETFVDSLAQMAPLCAEHHRAVERGVHMGPFPLWILQAFPKRQGMHEFSPEDSA